MNYLTFHDFEIGRTRVSRIIVDPADEGKCGEYRLTVLAQDWCAGHVGRVDVDHDEFSGACRLTFVDDGAAMLFAMRFNVEFAFRN